MILTVHQLNRFCLDFDTKFVVSLTEGIACNESEIYIRNYNLKFHNFIHFIISYIYKQCNFIISDFFLLPTAK